jgi:hypothetical protein
MGTGQLRSSSGRHGVTQVEARTAGRSVDAFHPCAMAQSGAELCLKDRHLPAQAKLPYHRSSHFEAGQCHNAHIWVHFICCRHCRDLLVTSEATNRTSRVHHTNYNKDVSRLSHSLVKPNIAVEALLTASVHVLSV